MTIDGSVALIEAIDLPSIYERLMDEDKVNLVIAG